MANQQTAPVMLDDELRANMTHDEQIQHLEALVRRVRDQWQAEHREYQRRASAQEAEITRLIDRLEAAQEEINHAWSLAPDARQREEIQKRTSWSTHTDPGTGGTAIVAECQFRGHHFHAEDLLSREILERSADALDFQVNDVSQRLARGILAGACKELGIRTEEQEVNLQMLAKQGEQIFATLEQTEELDPPAAVQAMRDHPKDAVYIAGPMTGIPDLNIPEFNRIADLHRHNGYTVVNPADHGEVEGATWSDYLRYDLQELAECGQIFMLRGWENSKGARLEWNVARELGITIEYQDGAVRYAGFSIPEVDR